MLKRLLSAALTGCLLLTCSQAFAYYSKDSYEGEVTFTSMVEIAEDAPDFLLLPSYINRQLLYLAGPLQAAPKKAAAKNDAKVDVLGKHRDGKTGKLYVRYRYTGIFVLDSGLQDIVKICLPLNLDEIWERSSNNCFSWGDKYRMAYFWAPLNKGCALVEGVDYVTSDGTIVAKQANTTNTAPAYERLANGNGEIRIVLTFGADDDRNGKPAPDTTTRTTTLPTTGTSASSCSTKASRCAPSPSTSASVNAATPSRWPTGRAMSRSSPARTARARSSSACSGASPTSGRTARPSSAWRRRLRNAVPCSCTPDIPASACSISPTWASRSARPSR